MITITSKMKTRSLRKSLGLVDPSIALSSVFRVSLVKFHWLVARCLS